MNILTIFSNYCLFAHQFRQTNSILILMTFTKGNLLSSKFSLVDRDRGNLQYCICFIVFTVNKV